MAAIIVENATCQNATNEMLLKADRPQETSIECPPQEVEAAGLIYASDAEPGIRRLPVGKNFSYRLPAGRRVRDISTLKRIQALAIPPAWTDVWICPKANGHIQATGRDDRGRKQYRYHASWAECRDQTKFNRILAFAQILPKVRRTVKRHMRLKKLTREKVLATVVYLLENTLVRVGNAEYARTNKSYGLTTLKDRHVTFDGPTAKFRFHGKTGKEWRVDVHDRRIARIIKGCHDLPGQHLFQYEDGAGEPRPITSSDVNDYLRQFGAEDISAKDFRTWAGTVLTAVALAEFDAVNVEAAAKRNIRQAINQVAMRLGNTPTICRKCYIHPEILCGYLEGDFVITGKLTSRTSELTAAEAGTLAFLHRRLKSQSRRSQPKNE